MKKFVFDCGCGEFSPPGAKFASHFQTANGAGRSRRQVICVNSTGFSTSHSLATFCDVV
jgi:hypothetical protein